MKSYKLILDQAARSDIREAAKWYEKRVVGLDTRFKENVKQQIGVLKINADGYSIRYKKMHCMPVQGFPFLIHFVINDSNTTVTVLAVIHTSRNPKIWEEKTKDI
jgi:hypothetical protein